MARRAKALTQLVAEVDMAFPERQKGKGSSDGWLGDQSHQARKSDHNPDGNGVVRAQDIDEDLYGAGNQHGEAAMAIVAEHVRRLGEFGDSRLVATATGVNGYVIYEGRIAGAGKGWHWRKYTGPNSHAHHIHVSVCADTGAHGYDSTASWHIADLFAEPAPLPGLEYLEDFFMPVVAQWQDAVFLVDYDMGTGTCRRRTFPDESRLGQVVHSQGVYADRSKNPYGDAFPVLNDQFETVYQDLGPV